MSIIDNALDKNNSVTRRIKKPIKLIYKKFDMVLETRERIRCETEEKTLVRLKDSCETEIRNVGLEFSYLANYEVSCEAFKKYVTDEKYLPLIDEAYEAGKRYIEKEESWFRLRETPCGSKRKARREMEDIIDKLKKGQSIGVRLLYSKEMDGLAKEAVYSHRDWLINDFDALIDSIEPVRQEYIISRKGEVSVEEVEEMLLEKFDVYEKYTSELLYRRDQAMSYYPGLKIE